MARKKKENKNKAVAVAKATQKVKTTQKVVVNIGSNQVRRKRVGKGQTVQTQIVSGKSGMTTLAPMMMGMVSAMSTAQARAMADVSARNDALRLGENDRMRVIQQMGAIEEEKKEMTRRNREAMDEIRLERERNNQMLEEGKSSVASLIPSALMRFEEKKESATKEETERIRAEARSLGIPIKNSKNETLRMKIEEKKRKK